MAFPTRVFPGYILIALAGGVAGWMLKPANSGVDSSSPFGSGAGTLRRDYGSGAVKTVRASRIAGVLAEALDVTGATDIPPADSPEFSALILGTLSEPVKEKRTAQLQLLLEKMIPDQLAAVVPLIREVDLRGTSNGDEWTLLFNQWGRTDGQGAMAFVQKYDWSPWDPAAASEAQSRAMSGWAGSNLKDALAFVENPTGPVVTHGRSLQYSLLRGWADSDPAAAGKWLLGRQDSSGEGDSKLVLEGLSRQGGPAAVEAWFASEAAGRTGLPSVGNFASSIAHTKLKYDPEAAAKWLEPYGKAEWAASTGAFFSTGGALAGKDPVAAMAWAERTGLPLAAAGAMQQWCRQDMTAASVWLRDHTTHPGYNSAVEVLAGRLLKDDPEAARLWVESITDPDTRTRFEEQLKSRTSGQNPPNR